MKITINEVLVLQKAMRYRADELRHLRTEVSTDESIFYGKEERKIKNPRYDVKAVDKKIVELEMFIFKTDTSVKISNAKTEIEIDFDVDKLLEPLQ